MPRPSLLLTIVVTANIAVVAPVKSGPPPGFIIPKSTLSPEKEFGILVPEQKSFDAGEKNKLVKTSTGDVIAVIVGEPGMENMNNGGVAPTRWSSDSSLLLWRVDGKWFPRALVLIKLNGDKVEWQLDLLKTAQQEILAQASKEAPKQYAAAKKQNAGNGSAYPDGFTIDVTMDGEDETPVTLPLLVHVTLTSNPKAIEDYPEDAQLEANLEGEVGADGKFKVLKFDLQS